MQLDRVYRDYSALENFVVRVMISCETKEQLAVANNVHMNAMRVVKEYHPNRLADYLDKINSSTITMMAMLEGVEMLNDVGFSTIIL